MPDIGTAYERPSAHSGLTFRTACSLTWRQLSSRTCDYLTVFTNAILQFAKTTYTKRDVLVFLIALIVMIEYLPSRIHYQCQLYSTSKTLQDRFMPLIKMGALFACYALFLQIFVYWTIFKLENLGFLTASTVITAENQQPNAAHKSVERHYPEEELSFD